MTVAQGEDGDYDHWAFEYHEQRLVICHFPLEAVLQFSNTEAASNEDRDGCKRDEVRESAKLSTIPDCRESRVKMGGPCLASGHKEVEAESNEDDQADHLKRNTGDHDIHSCI